MTPTQHPPTSSRQGRGLALAAAVVTLAGVAGIAGLVHGDAHPGPAAQSGSPTSTAVGSASASATPTPPKPSYDAQGYAHSAVRPTGRYTIARLSRAPRRPGTRLVRYAVRVEQGTGIDASAAAAQVQQVLDDPRSWNGTRAWPTRGVHFQLLPTTTGAELTITLASPQTVRKLCPLDTHLLWSCDDGKHVLINSDRWLYRVPAFASTDAYREYLVNHEVGHFLGLGHQQCLGAGRPAPVMMQQSKGVGRCRPNSWPTVA